MVGLPLLIALIVLLVFLSIGIPLLNIMVSNIFNKEQPYYLDLLLKSFKQGTLDENSISLIYNDFKSRCQRHFIVYFLELSPSYKKFLENFLIYVREKDEDGSLTKGAHKIFDPLLEKIKYDDPTSKLDFREKRLLSSIIDVLNKSTVILQSEKSAIKTNLNELANGIEDKQKKLENAQYWNKWTVPISIIGTIATLAFGFYEMFK